MLEKLTILNGVLSPAFDSYNTTYSVLVGENVDYLDIEYQTSDNAEAIIINNSDLLPGENIVYIDVVSPDDLITYNLIVYKEETKEVMAYDEFYNSIEFKPELPDFVAPLIVVVCFFIILLNFVLLFNKRRK